MGANKYLCQSSELGHLKFWACYLFHFVLICWIQCITCCIFLLFDTVWMFVYNSLPLFKVVSVIGDRQTDVDSEGKSTADASVVKNSGERDRATHHKQGQVFQTQAQKNDTQAILRQDTWSYIHKQALFTHVPLCGNSKVNVNPVQTRKTDSTNWPGWDSPNVGSSKWQITCSLSCMHVHTHTWPSHPCVLLPQTVSTISAAVCTVLHCCTERLSTLKLYSFPSLEPRGPSGNPSQKTGARYNSKGEEIWTGMLYMQWSGVHILLDI